MKILVILGSTRETRKGIHVLNWVLNQQFENVELINGDLIQFNLSHYNEPSSPRSSKGNYLYQETRNWSKVVEDADAFIFITPEYNGYFTGALKDAIDLLYYEWEGKPYSVIGYGSRGAKRAIDQLHNLLTAFHMKRMTKELHILKPWESVKERTVHPDYIEGSLTDIINELTK